MSQKLLGYTITGLVVLAVGIGALGYIRYMRNPGVSESKEQIPSIRDCGSDFDCLIAVAPNCEQARARLTGTVNVFGIEQSATTIYEIRGFQDNLCTLYLRVEKAETRYSNELVQQLLNAGQSLEQIRQQEQQVKQASAATIGKDGTCQFEVERLVSLLRKWKSGSFSGGVTIDPVSGKQQELTGDFAGANCQGSYFSD